jgi:hypothetical protein
MKWFAEEYTLPKPVNLDNLERILSTVQVVLETQLGHHVLVRELENVLCKVFWSSKNPVLDQVFSDILVPTQDLFVFQGDSLTVHTHK